MQETPEQIADIIFRVLRQDATDNDMELLDNWKHQSPENEAFVKKVLQAGYIPQGLRELALAQQKSSDRLASQNVSLLEYKPLAPVHRVHFLKTSWFRYAAAVVVLLGGVGSYFWLSDRQPETVATTNGNKHLQTDISPGSNKAILTLSDGTTIVLDNADNGNVAQQGSTKIIKLDAGQLAYSAGKGSGSKVLYNTISTPRGGQYQVLLPDGSKVWLNTASWVKFPTAFRGSSREVEIDGEAYLEVAQNIKQPFVVSVNGSKIEVLGTSFNVNGYDDESALKTTLIAGSVRIVSGVETAVLKPGEQCSVTAGRTSVITHVDIEKVIAWKNGLFNFNGADFSAVMRQLERWYDIKVQYEGSVPAIIFKGEMYRNLNLSDVLEVLQKMGVKFRLEGKTLIVLNS